jgi:hypothetical protein
VGQAANRLNCPSGEAQGTFEANARLFPQCSVKRGGEVVKMPSWLQWASLQKSTVTKSDDIKTIRRRTDQRLRRQEAQKLDAEKEKLVACK